MNNALAIGAPTVAWQPNCVESPFKSLCNSSDESGCCSTFDELLLELFTEDELDELLDELLVWEFEELFEELFDELLDELSDDVAKGVVFVFAYKMIFPDSLASIVPSNGIVQALSKYQPKNSR